MNRRTVRLTMYSRLTPLKREALQLLSNGRMASELSGSLNLTVLETESLVTRLFATLGATTQAEAVVWRHPNYCSLAYSACQPTGRRNSDFTICAHSRSRKRRSELQPNHNR